ncbi:MAG TPA: OmpH family outer membrane protein [Pirellulales bacterium]|nr:OmpH family outer membrane protein [Pirellulales bacterium]
MKTPFLSALCVASLLALSAPDAFAQQRAPGQSSPGFQSPSGQPGGLGSSAGSGGLSQPSSGGAPANFGATSGMGGARPVMGQATPGVVAVIDLNHVMNNYVKAKTMVEDLQKDGMAADTQLRKDNAQIEALKEKLKDFKPGTADYKKREEEITQRISDLKVRASIEQRDFQERQMKAMYVIYCEITDEVKRYAQANGIALVMDYSSDKVDMDVPATIQRQVQKPFVYQSGPDITQTVLTSLNQRAQANRQPGGGGPPGGATRR